MPIYKGDKKGTWVTSFYYKDWQGNNIKKMKRGFLTKKEAQVWTNEFLQKESKNLRKHLTISILRFSSHIFCKISVFLYENCLKGGSLPAQFSHKKLKNFPKKSNYYNYEVFP